MKLPIANIADVVERQLCSGCGVCAYVEPARFRIGDSEEFGRRPFLVAEPADESGLAVSACPGAKSEHTFDRSDPDLLEDLTAGWGPVFEVWEGYASADEIRFAGSSGGAATASPFTALKQRGVAGVLHTAAHAERQFSTKPFSAQHGEN